MSHCTHCQSRFFKTLETRLLPEESTGAGRLTLLLKKRCKRCKFKFLFRKDYPTGRTGLISRELWLQGIRIPNGAISISDGNRLFTGEYSRKISRRAEQNISYMHRLRKLERSGHA